ncbi:MAG: DUF1801 domain-containing protein [Leptolyngbyaceae cyanobacterium MO_188.B28]|nr:DUF1801 domain-containing protein [Leptolyngbyaceae cyanobacterium MO_188.B28]
MTTPKEYIEVIDDDWRKEKLLALRVIIQKKAPDIFEGIHFKMLSYGGDNRFAFHLNVQRNYVSLYVGDIEKVDPDGELLKGINRGKGCIRFTKSVSITETRIEEFIEKAIDLWRQGADLNC